MTQPGNTPNRSSQGEIENPFTADGFGLDVDLELFDDDKLHSSSSLKLITHDTGVLGILATYKLTGFNYTFIETTQARGFRAFNRNCVAKRTTRHDLRLSSRTCTLLFLCGIIWGRRKQCLWRNSLKETEFTNEAITMRLLFESIE